MNGQRTFFLTAALAFSCALPSAAQADETPKPAAPKAVPRGSGPLAGAEWDFLKAAGQDRNEDVLELALPQLEDWLARNPEHPAAGEAQFLKAALHHKLGDHKSALLGLLKYFQVYPRGSSLEDAKKLFTEILVTKADKKLRPVLEGAAALPEGGAAAANVSALLEKLSAQAGEAYYEPLTAEFRVFFNSYPDHAKSDSLRLALADLHRSKGRHLAARLDYEKLIQLYPSSPLLPGAKLSLGGVLAENLKDYDRAIGVYQDIAASFPGTDEAWTAYGRLPALAEKQKKYGLAAELYEKIIELYPDKSAALNSYKAEARLLREDLKKFPEAVAVLNRLADKYKGESVKCIDALLLAAEICRKDMKDAECEVKMYDRIAGEYEADPQAPKALYAAGDVYSKAKDGEKAREYYQKVLEKYPDNPLSKKAENRVASIISGKI
ncbi:MAG: tetratricopeptide repeat protein [Elusimicrobia bacterium]|nr:tetratricopeptide repeat protein [Elusimicrobiota bacterium]